MYNIIKLKLILITYVHDVWTLSREKMRSATDMKGTDVWKVHRVRALFLINSYEFVYGATSTIALLEINANAMYIRMFGFLHFDISFAVRLVQLKSSRFEGFF